MRSRPLRGDADSPAGVRKGSGAKAEIDEAIAQAEIDALFKKRKRKTIPLFLERCTLHFVFESVGTEVLRLPSPGSLRMTPACKN
jgi:hypothetical protein